MAKEIPAGVLTEIARARVAELVERLRGIAADLPAWRAHDKRALQKAVDMLLEKALAPANGVLTEEEIARAVCSVTKMPCRILCTDCLHTAKRVLALSPAPQAVVEVVAVIKELFSRPRYYVRAKDGTETLLDEEPDSNKNWKAFVKAHGGYDNIEATGWVSFPQSAAAIASAAIDLALREHRFSSPAPAGEARDAALEEAAKIADQVYNEAMVNQDQANKIGQQIYGLPQATALRIAAAIRALKTSAD